MLLIREITHYYCFICVNTLRLSQIYTRICCGYYRELTPRKAQQAVVEIENGQNFCKNANSVK